MADANTKDASAGQDQSMEEILQSIRRIIAEEGDKTDSNDGAHMNDAAKGSDVLELTDVVNDDGSVININSQKDSANMAAFPPPEAPAAKPSSKDVLTNIDMALSSKSTDAGYGLLENETIATAAAALKPLTGASANTGLRSMPSTPSPAFRSGTTVEDLVLEALRPMLKQWLDTNLPAVVERLVEREVRKISSRFDS